MLVGTVKKMRRFAAKDALLAIVLSMLAAHAYSASKTVLVLGDSLSAEYGLPRGTGWVSLLSKRIEKDNVDAAIINASISGETTSGGKARLAKLLQKHQPAVVVIELGGNDGLRGLPLKSAEQNLRTMIGESKKAKARVVLLGMKMPPNYGPQYASQFADMYPKLAKETGAALAPFFLEDVTRDAALFQADGIHPTTAAQPMMLKAVWPHLQPLLLENKR